MGGVSSRVRRALLSALWLLGSTWSAGCSWGVPLSSTEVVIEQRGEPLIIDMLPDGGGQEQVSFTFRLKNESQQPVLVKVDTLACNCRVVRLTKRKLKPGEVTELTLARSLRGLVRSGEAVLEAWVTFSNGQQYRCIGRCRVLPRLERSARRGKRVFRPGERGEITLDVYLHRYRDEPGEWEVVLQQAAGPFGRVDAELEQGEDQELGKIVARLYRLRVRVRAPLDISEVPDSSVQWFMRARPSGSDDRAWHEVVVGAAWRVESLFERKPLRAVLAPGAKSVVEVASRDARPFAITGWRLLTVDERPWESAHRPVSAVTWSPDADARYRVEIEAAPEADLAFCFLALQTDVAEEPTIFLPVSTVPQAGAASGGTSGETVSRSDLRR